MLSTTLTSVLKKCFSSDNVLDSNDVGQIQFWPNTGTDTVLSLLVAAIVPQL